MRPRSRPTSRSTGSGAALRLDAGAPSAREDPAPPPGTRSGSVPGDGAAAGHGEQRGVDRAFLGALLELRRAAGRLIHLVRPQLADEDVDEQAQVLVDRLLFMHAAEDHEPRLLGGRTLAGIAGDGAQGAAGRTAAAFAEVRRRYRGDLFGEQLLDTLELPDEPVFSILKGLVPPALEVRLSAFPAGFLGSVYERQMGLRLAAGSGEDVRLEARPGGNRSRGAHYTPFPVVRYVIEQSLGRWLWQGPVPSAAERADRDHMAGREWRSLSEVAKTRLLDPSCGGGAFLLVALDALVDWHLERARWRPGDLSPEDRQSLYALTGRGLEGARPALKARLASTHLYGVDVDSRALEVARMSLYLRILENGGSQGSETLLPDLTSNLRCGNALVEPAWVRSTDALDRIRPWDPRGASGVAPILEAGGFDFVVGNPPYVFGEHIAEDERAAYARYALGRAGQPDLYKLFYERTVEAFLRPGGWHGFVVPDALLARDEHRDVRRWVSARLSLKRLNHVGRVFEGATVALPAGASGPRRAVGVSSVVVIGQKGETPGQGACQVDTWASGRVATSRDLPAGALGKDGAPWSISAPPGWLGESGLKSILEAAPSRVESFLADAGPRGITRGEELGKGSLESCEVRGVARDGHVPIYAGADVRRHFMMPAARQAARASLRKPAAYYLGPKVCFVKTGAGPVAAPCYDDLPALQSVYLLHLSRRPGAVCPDVLAAVLCSAPVTAYAFFTWTSGKLLQPQFTIDNVKALPVPALDRATSGAIRRATGTLRELLARGEGASPRAVRERLAAEAASAEMEVDALVCGAFRIRLEAWKGVLGEAFQSLPASQRPRWWAG